MTRIHARAAQGRPGSLFDAANCGDVDAVRRMLADGADIEHRGPVRWGKWEGWIEGVRGGA